MAARISIFGLLRCARPRCGRTLAPDQSEDAMTSLNHDLSESAAPCGRVNLAWEA